MPRKQYNLDKIIKNKERPQQFEEEVRQRKVQEGLEAEARANKISLNVLIG